MAALEEILAKIDQIVVTEGEDKGVVLLPQEAPTRFDEELRGRVYIHKYFSPLGDALIELHEMVARLRDDLTCK